MPRSFWAPTRVVTTTHHCKERKETRRKQRTWAFALCCSNSRFFPSFVTPQPTCDTAAWPPRRVPAPPPPRRRTCPRSAVAHLCRCTRATCRRFVIHLLVIGMCVDVVVLCVSISSVIAFADGRGYAASCVRPGFGGLARMVGSRPPRVLTSIVGGGHGPAGGSGARRSALDDDDGGPWFGGQRTQVWCPRSSCIKARWSVACGAVVDGEGSGHMCVMRGHPRSSRAAEPLVFCAGRAKLSRTAQCP